jgi:hypothetical protein
MDIEGAELDVIYASLNTFKQADVISLEFHGTRQRVDELLLNHGFVFKPVTMTYVYKRILKNLLLHPFTLCRVYTDTIFNNPQIIGKAIAGLDMTKGRFLAGSYIKRKGQHNLAR